MQDRVNNRKGRWRQAVLTGRKAVSESCTGIEERKYGYQECELRNGLRYHQ